ncbi:MAG: hypothetical protein V4644_00385 [Patescibacteria group bacterium]
MSTEIRPHILVVQHPNPTHRNFGFITELSSNRNPYGFGSSHYSNFEKKNPGALAKTITERLLAIPGVTGGHIDKYEVSVAIGQAFSWEDLGPLVLGQLIKSIYPEVIGSELLISTRVGWVFYVRPSDFGFMGESDNGHRTRYQDMAKRESIIANLGSGRPSLNIEHLLNVEDAQAENHRQLVSE